MEIFFQKYTERIYPTKNNFYHNETTSIKYT